MTLFFVLYFILAVKVHILYNAPMEIIYYIFVLIAGLLFGSFLNLVADRIVKGESILFGRSHCDHCMKNLVAGDLVPLLSFMLAKGKCRYCSNKLSRTYPFSEILTGLIFVGLAYFTGVFTEAFAARLPLFAFLAVTASFYIVLFLTDLKYRLIPDKVVKPAIVFVFLFNLIFMAYLLGSSYYQLRNDDFGKYLLQAGFWHLQLYEMLRRFAVNLISAITIALFFWFLVYITKGRGMGGGDIKLGLLIGLVNGFPSNVIAIFLGFVFGALISILLIILRKKTVKDTIAFGPFLIAGSVAALVWGDLILSWYLRAF